MRNKALEDIFYNVENNGVFGTAKTLKNKLKFTDSKHLTNKKIIEWILHQDVATLHKQHKGKNQRNHYIINAKDSLWEMDLLNMKSFSSSNDDYKYILTVIDVFSKFAWAKPVKNKTANEIFKAFKDVITHSGRKPQAVQSDLGTEFKNQMFQKYFYANNIQQHFPKTQSYHKCGVIERWNRNLKEKLFKYFTYKGPRFRRYIDVLQYLVDAYNNTKHTTTGFKPAEVKPKHTVEIYANTRKSQKRIDKEKLPALNVNDYVRLINKKKPLEHAYTEKWSRSVYIIHTVINSKPYAMYKLKDLKGKHIEGKFL